ncbi:MAG: pro-sigmaK processing inhibitor BofA family protein [Ruminococcus sp.]|nr:pro-sigmaK processing inhibitor BofA family protein [Ruminococcus sp.]
MTADQIFKGVCAAVIFVMLIYYIRRERKLRSILFGALTGAAALFILNKYGGYIGVEIPLNVFNLAGSTILGVPFVICLVILRQL